MALLHSLNRFLNWRRTLLPVGPLSESTSAHNVQRVSPAQSKKGNGLSKQFADTNVAMEIISLAEQPDRGLMKCLT